MNRLVTLLALSFLLTAPPAAAQDAAPDTTTAAMDSPVTSTPAAERLAGHDRRAGLAERSLVSQVPFENIGPTVMSGRVVDVDVRPDDPTHFYVAYASGGLWKTTNNGQSFEPHFDDQSAMTMGDIAVDWSKSPETVWVGTGENNSSRSSYAGTGIYKSTDGAQTWQHLGLEDTHRTGRIVMHPEDPNTVWVAALGPLYSASEARGVYKSTDGGGSWTKTLFVGENTGAIDLVMHPENPDVLYAAMWHRLRRAWNFVESGEESGIYKSTDGGENWQLITTEESGFPTGEGVGRIGLAVTPDAPDIVYALLDNQERRPEEEDDEEPALTKENIREMTKAEFLEVSQEEVKEYLERNGFPASYTAESIMDMVRQEEIAPLDLVRYLEDANAQLFDTPVKGAEVYRSSDGGQTWTKPHAEPIDETYYSYGYYFGEIRAAPDDADRIYIMGVPILKSTDGGETFTGINAPNVHVDHHALWVSPQRPGHLVNGNDGGVNISYDDGETWFKANTPPVGQFYAVQVDEAEPYRVYGGLQDNGVWAGAHTYDMGFQWYAEGDYPYDRLLGGDGMQIEVDTRTNDIVYTGFQFGFYFRIDQETGERTAIKPQHELGERPLRFNWQTPIHLSRHNQDILYLGSNKFHRSLDRGETWETLSGDLSATGGRKGDVPYGTLTMIDESPFRFGLIYAGTDDGLIHVSRDAGTTWQNVSEGLPENLWVARVEASSHDTSRVWAALNGYRWDDFAPYLYRSDNYGETWERIGQDLPMEPINVVVEDPENERIVYVGTDNGLYVSLDGGGSFMEMTQGMPNAPVHDLKIQKREKDLLAGTHGRSIYRADLEEVQQLTPELLEKPLHAFALDSLTYDENWGGRRAAWMDAEKPSLTIPYFSGSAGETTIRIQSEDGTTLQTIQDTTVRGLNYATYDLTVDTTAAASFIEDYEADRDDDAPKMESADDGKMYLVPGTYTVEITRGGETVTQPLRIKAPPEEERPAAPEPDEVVRERGKG